MTDPVFGETVSRVAGTRAYYEAVAIMDAGEYRNAEATVADKAAPTDIRILCALCLVLDELRELRKDLADADSWRRETR